MDNIETLKNLAKKAINEASDREALRQVERDFLGKNSKLTLVLRGLKSLPEIERKKVGKEANGLKKILADMINQKMAAFGGQNRKKSAGFLDVSAPGMKKERGHIHPLSLVINNVCDIFQSMGFEVLSGPDVETEYYNFDALNIPADHPARDMWDTFWLGAEGQGSLLRTHTSPMQVRFMETHNPPFRIIVPGRVYRYEATDATHEIQFYQLEGLMIGKEINLSHLKGVMESFLKKLFNNKNLKVRFRPSYFPFTEPSLEVDLMLDGKWLEIAGAGMVHPQVLKNVKIDSDEWRGFAFGVGIDRIAMIKYGIDDIRLFYGSDLRFIRQFK